MIVGALRQGSTYRSKVRWYKDGPISEIEYYKAAPDAEWLPIPHVFAPIGGDREENQNEPGEITGKGKRDYRNPSPLLPEDGKRYVGTPEDFLGLVSYPGPVAPGTMPECGVPQESVAQPAHLAFSCDDSPCGPQLEGGAFCRFIAADEPDTVYHLEGAATLQLKSQGEPYLISAADDDVSSLRLHAIDEPETFKNTPEAATLQFVAIDDEPKKPSVEKDTFASLAFATGGDPSSFSIWTGFATIRLKSEGNVSATPVGVPELDGTATLSLCSAGDDPAIGWNPISSDGEVLGDAHAVGTVELPSSDGEVLGDAHAVGTIELPSSDGVIF